MAELTEEQKMAVQKLNAMRALIESFHLECIGLQNEHSDRTDGHFKAISKELFALATKGAKGEVEIKWPTPQQNPNIVPFKKPTVEPEPPKAA